MLKATTLVVINDTRIGFFLWWHGRSEEYLKSTIFIVYLFGPPVCEDFGSFDWAVLRFGEIRNSDYSPMYPLLTFCMYHATFAVNTPALISGAIVGRMKMISYMIFIFIWSTVCYDPIAHWVWGGSDLVASTILGRRHDYDPQSTTAHNLPFTRLVTCLLWVAALALINSNVAAAFALVTWVAIDAVRGHIAISGACSGSIVGFVVITPACGFVQLGWGLLIGVIGAIIVYCLLLLKRYMQFDDTLDIVCGIYGALITGLFAQKIVNSGGDDGAFYGHSVQLWYQIAGILTTIGFAAVWTTGILFPLDLIIGIRLPHEDELAGLDIADIKM
ncbi:unnamed protein product [Rotaria magnacalcarata]|uniref:Ammonium transporter AmtB-like domain-containing protein n=1 Tax=Rotaria magnacalcarata TaxID=392030 RepID=A0A816VGI8_9BILA|nr:unnamed protein product [Rotaria magnacalcarata]